MKPLACRTFKRTQRPAGPRTITTAAAATSATHFRFPKFMLSPHPDDLPSPLEFGGPLISLPDPRPAAPKTVLDVTPVYADVPLVKPTPTYTRHHYLAVLDFPRTVAFDEPRPKVVKQRPEQRPADNTPFNIDWVATVFVTMIFGSKGFALDAQRIDVCTREFGSKIIRTIVEGLKLTNAEIAIALHCVSHLSARATYNHFSEPIVEARIPYLGSRLRHIVMMGVMIARPDSDNSLALFAFHSGVRYERLPRLRYMARTILGDQIVAPGNTETWNKMVDDLLLKIVDCHYKYEGGRYLEERATTAFWELTKGRSTSGRP